MRLFIEHLTTLSYDAPINEAHTEVRLKPADAGGQRCLSFKLLTEPVKAHVLAYIDHFGNDVRYFDWLQPHQRLSIAVTSEVLTAPLFDPGAGELTPLEEYDYCHPTAYAPADEAICRFAGPHILPDDPLGTARTLSEAVFRSIKYERGATDVKTTADDVIRLGRGVCQDFAHLLIACCRCQGIPARYVSGYLYDPKFFGDTAATHAWVDVFIAGHGWISLDPTHNCEQNERYVRVAVGRDYADVPPTRGVFKGNAKETLEVRVVIRAL
ncbi:MAG: transglutaminase family protein [Anaerolineae bacterium]|nr:transglutaminase family protein [Thermoflexales bacterium]MDW8406932.1 transglutaminase family protein [Anaerolineae bacterium]